ncbi:hypothetical protein HJA77_13840 [Rhizobium bangladeshense]|uniref:hypothetical protein n=1 Tax=Rhizobium bangladeshense TaxID=1138189 RepID=UPI001C909CE2|nr:hypothetical protein [Rhizobium bangladeshense]MBY3582240.1 hypothetical protein [Rhizobium bangladeshense]
MLKSPHPAVDLSFMRPKTRDEGGGIKYWNVQTAGDYSVTGNYTSDSAKGRSLALEYLEYVGKHPTVGNATLLGNIVLDMIDQQAAKGLVLGFMSAINDYSMTVARIVAGNVPSTSAPGPSITRVIEEWRNADTRFSNEVTLTPGDHDELWQAKEDAETAMLKEPCLSLEDIRTKAEIALRDENVFDTIANCTIGSEHALRVFLQSLLGDKDPAHCIDR